MKRFILLPFAFIFLGFFYSCKDKNTIPTVEPGEFYIKFNSNGTPVNFSNNIDGGLLEANLKTGFANNSANPSNEYNGIQISKNNNTPQVTGSCIFLDSKAVLNIYNLVGKKIPFAINSPSGAVYKDNSAIFVYNDRFTWQLNTNVDSANNFIKILSADLYNKAPYNTGALSYYKVKAEFKCKLNNNGTILNIDNGETTFLIAR